MPAPAPCALCPSPAVDPAAPLPLCAEHAALARQVANQKLDIAIQTIRALKAHTQNEEAA